MQGPARSHRFQETLIVDRWSGPFATPNVAGLELALAVVVALVIAVRPWPALGRASSPCRVLAGLAGITALVLLAMTGSRAGGLALIAGMLALAGLRVLSWRWTLGGLAGIAGAYLLSGAGPRLWPDGTEQSIVDRTVLWRASLALIADHPWIGVGSDLAGLLGDWYLPDGFHRRFATALNDLLTAAAYGGLPAAGVICALLAALGAGAARRAQTGDALAAMAVALTAAHLIAGMFQAHLFAPWSTARWSGALVLTLLAWSALRAPWRTLAKAGVTAGILVPLCLILACGWAAEGPWRTTTIGPMLLAEPRTAPAEGLVVVLLHPDDREAVISGLIPQLHRQHLAVTLFNRIPGPPELTRLTSLYPAGGGVTIVAARDLGLQLWEDWRAARLPASVTALVVDPDGAPTQAADPAKRGRLLILPVPGLTIPRLDDLRQAVTRDATSGPAEIAPGIAGRSLSDRWPQAWAWWQGPGARQP